MYRVLFFSLFLFHSLFAQVHNVRLVGNDWCPQHCMNNPKAPGYLVELTQTALKEVGMQSQMTFRPWLRAIKNVHSGVYDGLMTPAQSEEKELIRHKIPLATQRYCFYTKKSNPLRLLYLRDFQNRHIAYTKGNHLGNRFMSFIENKKNNITVYEIVSNNQDYAPQIFNILLKNRVDAIALTEDFADYYLGRQKSLKQQVQKQYCTQSEKLFVGLSPTNPKRSRFIAEQIDKGLMKIQQNGQYQKILEKYHLNQ